MKCIRTIFSQCWVLFFMESVWDQMNATIKFKSQAVKKCKTRKWCVNHDEVLFSVLLMRMKTCSITAKGPTVMKLMYWIYKSYYYYQLLSAEEGKNYCLCFFCLIIDILYSYFYSHFQLKSIWKRNVRNQI